MTQEVNIIIKTTDDTGGGHYYKNQKIIVSVHFVVFYSVVLIFIQSMYKSDTIFNVFLWIKDNPLGQ